MRRLLPAILVLIGLAILAVLLHSGATEDFPAPEAPPGAPHEVEAPPGGDPAGEQEDAAAAIVDPRRTGRLRIRVSSGAGPVPDARIEVRSAEGHALSLRADRRGSASLDAVPSGEVQLRTEADGYSPEATRAFVPLGGLVVAEVFLRRPRVLTGAVVGLDGAPVPGARVRLFGTMGVYLDGEAWESLEERLGEAMTGADGRFRADGLPGSWADSALFLVEAEGHRTTLYYGEDGIRIPLAPGGILTGRVSDPAGRPVAGAKVFAVPVSHRSLWRVDGAYRRSILDREEEAVVPLETVTDATGRYRLAGLGLSETYVLRIFADGFSFREMNGVRVGAGELDVALAPGGTLRATVRDESGRPIPGARVHVTGPWVRWFPGADADESGRVRIGALPSGRLSVRGSAAGYGYADVEVKLSEGEDAVAEIVLAPRAGRSPDSLLPQNGDLTLEGRVLFPDGEPVTGGSVTVLPALRRTAIEADGSFRIDFLPPGDVEVTADPRRGEDVLTRTTLPGPALRIVVPRMHGVRGRLVLPSGVAPPVLVAVRLPRGGTSVSWRPDAAGACPFDFRIGPGPCSISFHAAGFRPLDWSGEIPANGSVSAGDLELDAGRALTGRVVTEAGVPIADADVRVTDPGYQLYRTRTGPNGEFTLTGFGTEPTTLRATADGFLGATKSVPADAAETEFVLSPGIGVEVSVVTEAGVPIRGAEVELHILATGKRARTMTTGTDGRARYRVVPGSYRVTATVPRHVTGGAARSETRLLELDAARPTERVVLSPR